MSQRPDAQGTDLRHGDIFSELPTDAPSFRLFVHVMGWNPDDIGNASNVPDLKRLKMLLNTLVCRFIKTVMELGSILGPRYQSMESVVRSWGILIQNMYNNFTNLKPNSIVDVVERNPSLTRLANRDALVRADKALNNAFAQYKTWRNMLLSQYLELSTQSVGARERIAITQSGSRLRFAGCRSHPKSGIGNIWDRNYLNSLHWVPDMSGGGAALPLVRVRCVNLRPSDPMPKLDTFLTPPERCVAGYYLAVIDAAGNYQPVDMERIRRCCA